MENASKALIMAGGVLIGLLILALMITLFVTSSDLYTTYEETKKTEAIQQFNANFIPFTARKITIHEVITICNFANEYNVNITKVGSFDLDARQISKDIDEANQAYIESGNEKIKVLYDMEITNYTNGYVSAIKFSNRALGEL